MVASPQRQGRSGGLLRLLSPSSPIIVATRRSPLARAQTDLALAALQAAYPGTPFEVRLVETTGDVREHWSLEATGGTGLFTAELERLLLEGAADLAVHSAKDLPTRLHPGVELVGCLARANPQDVLILREGVESVATLATGSPRRREQMRPRFPHAHWVEIRGNVDTRLRRLAEGHADGTFLAAAGLDRLGITAWPALRFEPLPIEVCVPAAGQGAIALECRAGDAHRFANAICPQTSSAVAWERLALSQLGGGCHTAAAAHVRARDLRLFIPTHGHQQLQLPAPAPDHEDTRALVAEALQRFLTV